MNKPRCLWCHQYHDIMYEKMVLTINRLGIPKGLETEYFCREECFSKADGFLRKCARYSLPSLIYIGLTLVGIFNSIWVSRKLHIPNECFLALMLLPIGILLELVPFTTPETIQYFGLSKGIWMTRVIGLFLICLSVILIILK